MYFARVLSLLTALCCCTGLAGTAQAVQVDCDEIYCFSVEDFTQEASLEGIWLTQVPDSGQGQVMLGDRALRPGDVLTGEQVAKLSFQPERAQADQTVQVGYLPIYEDGVAPAATLAIGVLGKEDKAPAAEDFALETYKNLANSGTLKASDPEGQALTYTLVRRPRRGEVTLTADGGFTYTPKKNKVGVDSFTYTATDPAGNVSREATVTVTILKPTDAPQYTDTAGSGCEFAAEWMKHTGIFVGQSVAENSCFYPQREVTRGEFVAMLAKALELPIQEDAMPAGYEDEIPGWLRPYLAAAQRAGLTAGLSDPQRFSPDSPITADQAAVMLQNALDLPLEASATEEGDVTANVLAALGEEGIRLTAEEPLTRGQTALALYRTVQILNSRSR